MSALPRMRSGIPVLNTAMVAQQSSSRSKGSMGSRAESDAEQDVLLVRDSSDGGARARDRWLAPLVLTKCSCIRWGTPAPPRGVCMAPAAALSNFDPWAGGWAHAGMAGRDASLRITYFYKDVHRAVGFARQAPACPRVPLCGLRFHSLCLRARVPRARCPSRAHPNIFPVYVCVPACRIRTRRACAGKNT